MQQNKKVFWRDLLDGNSDLLLLKGLARVCSIVLMVVAFLFQVNMASANGLFDFQMKLAKQGNAEAEFKIGEMYETGFGTTKNMKLAREWITKAAAHGNEAANFTLLYWDMKKNGITKTNKAKYQELVKKARSGDAYALLYLGKIYAEGAGVPINRQKALDLYNKAMLKGSDEAERDASALQEKMRQESVARQKREQAQKARQEALQSQQQAEKLAAQKAAAAAAKRAANVAAQKKRKQAAVQAAAVIAAQKAANQKAVDQKAQQKADAKKKAAQQQALAAKRQALLKQRQKQAAKRKDEFDSDPCTGRSARFLSTCQ